MAEMRSGCTALVLCLLIPMTALGHGDKEREDPSQILGKATVFAVGPCGLAGDPSPESDALRSVLSDKDAVEKLQRLLDSQADVPRLYALLGLRQIDLRAFRAGVAASKKASDEDRAVMVQVGELIMPMEYGEVLSQLEAGYFDLLFDGHAEVSHIRVTDTENGTRVVISQPPH